MSDPLLASWFGWWLGLETPPDAFLSRFTMSLDAAGLGLAALTIAACAAGAVWAYRSELSAARATVRALLAALRILAVAVLCSWLFHPVGCSGSISGEQLRPIAVILDDSQSMRQADLRSDDSSKKIARDAGMPDSCTRVELGKAILAKSIEGIEKELSGKGGSRWYLSGPDLERFPDSRSAIEKWSGVREGSDLAGAIEKALDTTPAPGSIIIWTDARASGNPSRLDAALDRARRAETPVFVVGAGLEQPARLELRDLQAPTVAQAGERARALARLRVTGIDPARKPRAEIRLLLEGEEVAKDEISLEKDGEIQHGMVFLPPARLARPEGTRLEARVRVLDTDADPGDRLERRVTILDRPWRILIVDQAPRWDTRFLLMHLSRDGGEQAQATGQGRRAVAVEAFIALLDGDRELTTRPPFLPGFPSRRQDLFAFDAVILGDTDKDKLGENSMAMLRDFVEEGGGLIIQASPAQRSLAWAGTPLGDLLPVEISQAASDLPPEGYKPVQTSWGESHEALMLEDDKTAAAKVWKELPAWHWRAGVKRLKPGARPLLMVPGKQGDQSTVLATHAFGRGQVAWLGDDETWRWRLNTGDTIFGRFWNQWVQWAVASRAGGPRPVRLAIDRPDPAPGQPLSIRARVLDSSSKPLEAAALPARLVWLDAPPETPREQTEMTVSLKAIPGQLGEFAMTRIAEKPGRYQLVLTDRDGPALAWRVFPRDDVEPKGGLAAATAREIAARTGGAFIREEESAGFAAMVPPSTAQWSAPASIPALNPLAYLVFITALCAEWVIRRRNNLS